MVEPPFPGIPPRNTLKRPPGGGPSWISQVGAEFPFAGCIVGRRMPQAALREQMGLNF